MNINYDDWFYQFHQYLEGIRDGNVSYTDTNWADIGKRYQSLIDTHSSLLNEQPYAVVGNDIAFDKLLDLLEKSNYTYQDIDDALISTYKQTLRGSMSQMLVNTHNVIVQYKSNDKEHVYVDRLTQHYVIEVPFAQMHFGERDEMIRQRIEKMHATDTDLYVSLHEIANSKIGSILDFSMICTANGFICNDCYVAFSEKGLRFKINWNHPEDADFIIYKLDHGCVMDYEVPTAPIVNGDQSKTIIIPHTIITRDPQSPLFKHVGEKCLINIYDANMVSTETTVPNFGKITSTGIEIYHLQPYTIDMLNGYGHNTVNMELHCLQYLHEIPNVYPAMNYFDITDCKRVLTDTENEIRTPDGNRVLLRSDKTTNALEVCTPPICIDRDTSASFQIILDCLQMESVLENEQSNIQSIVQWFKNPNHRIMDIEDQIKYPAQSWWGGVYPYYLRYLQFATMTSLVPKSTMDRLQAFMDVMRVLKNPPLSEEIEEYSDTDDLYEYMDLVDEVCAPMNSSRFAPFRYMDKIVKNYYTDTTPNRFNRPVASQSFITLRYDRDDDCWVFANPDIQHFHGIGNTFYINNNLQGDEIFKFFVLYSDTEAPSALEIDDAYTPDIIMDFDKFTTEVNRHLGFVRYWNIENKLMKLSKMTFQTYSDESVVQVLSKILKRKLEGYDVLDDYGSDTIYTTATSTTLNLNDPTSSIAAPFAINYLFYTLALLQDNENKLQAYFFQTLTNRKFDPGYVDLDIGAKANINGSFPINLSRISRAPNQLDDGATNMLLDGKYHMYYSIPAIFQNKTNQTPSNGYRYTYNVYQNQTKYPCVTTENEFDAHDITFTNVSRDGYMTMDYTTDAYFARLLTFYLTYLRNVITELQTNYAKTFNQTALLQSAIKQLRTQVDQIKTYVEGKIFSHTDSMRIYTMVTQSNAMINYFERCITGIHNCLNSNELYSRHKNIFNNVNWYLEQLQQTYQRLGFDQIALKRIRKLYVTMKRINEPMTLYEYKEWLLSIDDSYLLNEVWAGLLNDNNYVRYVQWYEQYAKYFINAKNLNLLPAIETMETLMDELDTLKNTHLAPIEAYCADIINSYIFDLYAIKEINFASARVTSKPAYVIVEIPNDAHTHLPNSSGSGTVSLIMVPSVVDDNPSQQTASYTISDLRPIAEYAFFDGTKIPKTSITAKVYREDGTQIPNLTLPVDSITFCHVGTSSDTVSTIHQIPEIYNTRVDINNEHETVEVVNQKLVNVQTSPMHYELLYGNRFTTLTHTPEKISAFRSLPQGPIDRLYISNHKINRMVMTEYGNRYSQRVYVKPSQILHFEPDAFRRVRSIGGGNFVGQRIYLSAADTNYIFPATVTYIDHSQSRGILEAKVESRYAKWLELTSPELITRYLTTNIRCRVLPDNISNFLDEFSNPEYGVYYNPPFDQTIDHMDDVYTDTYALPGDPIFVQNNASYVYTRLSYFFHELTPNRFIDDEHKKMRFIYMGHCDSRYDQSPIPALIKIQCVKHHFNPLTQPEMYPILREEPNDHGVWQKENEVFNQVYSGSMAAVTHYNNQAIEYMMKMTNAKTQYDKQYWENLMNTARVRREMAYERAYQCRVWTQQREVPSTWYNVYSYEAAQVYIDNGRAYRSQTFLEDVRDIPWFDQLQVFLYNWDDHEWVDPSTYRADQSSMTGHMDDDAYCSLDNPDYFITTDVLRTMSIQPLNGFPHAKRLLIYFAYASSDFTNSTAIQLQRNCDVRFKPILSINHDALDDDPYQKLYVRKHFDVDETYTFDDFTPVERFSKSNVYHVERYKRSGDHVYSPKVRMCDITVTNHNTTVPFALYVKIPHPNVQTTQKVKIPSFTVTQHQPMEDFESNQTIKFICVQNRSDIHYNGSISTIIFEGKTGNTIDDPITITHTTLPPSTNGNFVCSVFMDTSYKCCGGLYTINMDPLPFDLLDGGWIEIPQSIGYYKEIPNECLIVPTTDIQGTTTIRMCATYTDYKRDTMDEDNTLMNPYEYYFNTLYEIRYPLSDVRMSDHTKRLVISTSLNANIQLVKSNYIGICRYALESIPKNGFIDVSGYIPTPLSRNRYEWWVNGRYVKDPDDLIILSPTTFQLRNLKSLHNFELVELVDDMEDNELMKRGNVYIDLNGNAYTSYERALLSNAMFMQQNLQYTFYGFPNHTKLQDYIGDLKPNPNNRDIEDNILSTLRDPNVNDYRRLYNVPSINGVSIYHLTTEQLGLQEIPKERILELYDKVWKYEILTDPNFPYTHADASMIEPSFNRIYVRKANDQDGMPNVNTKTMYVIYTTGLEDQYHTLFISTSNIASISDTTHTQKIIPFVKNGTKIYVDKKYRGMWIRSTNTKYPPKRIQ